MFQSTRLSKEMISSRMAILSGLASDSGLLVDESLFLEEISDYLNYDYLELTKIIAKKAFKDIDPKIIELAVDNAYQVQNKELMVDLVSLKDFHVLELFHGKTLAFKDLGLAFLAELMTLILEDKRALILVATSGDTGSSAIEAFKNKENIDLVVFYPNTGISQIQRDQMVKHGAKNVTSVAIDGNFDDAQRAVKTLLNDQDLIEKLAKKNVLLTSANSINIARLIPQIVYYFYAYKMLLKSDVLKMGEKINFIVPSGNFGNALAGYYAKKLGLKVNLIGVSTNENNVLDDFFKTGVYDINREFYTTSSPSMDILISSNLERLLYYKFNQNKTKVDYMMSELKKHRRFVLGKDDLIKLQKEFVSNTASNKEVLKMIEKIYKKDKYIIESHTATAVKLFYDKFYGGPNETVVLATASPLKFLKVVNQALELSKEEDEYSLIEDYLSHTKAKEATRLLELKNRRVDNDYLIKKDEIDLFIKELLGL